MCARMMIHQNSNLTASIAIETNGPNPFLHDIIEVCIVILDSEFKPNRNYLPFYTTMIPPNPGGADYDNMRMKKIDYYKLLQRSLEHDRVADLFEEWWDRLRLPKFKGIMPVVYDWQATHPFIQKWLGYEHTKYFFHQHVRDLLTAAVIENDKAAHHIEQYPFPKLTLQYICSCLKIERQKPHNTMQDCVAISKCFHRIMKEGAHVLKVKEEEETEQYQSQLPTLKDREEDVGKRPDEVSSVWAEGSFDS